MKFFRKRNRVDEFEQSAEVESVFLPDPDNEIDDSEFARAIAEGREHEQQYPRSA